ncbi:microtubule-associated protein 10-like [Hydractinia symbiolongicarpus]|uniref:microtubule-associated protein 10-like n=1 Tax=Hydractinia symbiolongicarpus TaxID=13093 RepID=UPI00254B7362|nr:microtubule-associated protein 10-like [Hydractinia symbiolongicarpus]
MEGECLFSFELFVKKIDYLNVTCNIPAVAFRLLDYPTLIIYFTSLQNIQRIKEKVGSENVNADVTQELEKMKSGSKGYDFEKGKSCLFQHKFETFNEFIQRVPLYIMILDTWSEKPKLLGSCLVPLIDLTKQINKTMSQFGQHCPAVGHQTGTYNICNLMGTSIGKISLGLKLTCYGQSLLRHVNFEGRRQKEINILLDIDDKERKEKKISAIIPNNEHIIVPADGKIASSKQCKPKFVKDEGVQCALKKKKKKCAIRQKETYLEVECASDDDHNIVCPPPLFINLKDEHKSRNFEKVKGGVRNSKYLYDIENDGDSLSSDEEPHIEILKPDLKKQFCYEVVNQNASVALLEEKKVKDVKEEAANVPEKLSLLDVKNLPVLCALLQEISKLTKNINENPVSKVSSPAENKEIVTERNRNIKISSKNFVSPHEISHIRMKKIDKKIKQPKSSRKLKRKEKLTYGFTRTQMLRYKLTHDHLLEHSEKKATNVLLDKPDSFEVKKSDVAVVDQNKTNVRKEKEIELSLQNKMNSVQSVRKENGNSSDAFFASSLTSVSQPESADVLNGEDSFHGQDIAEKKTGFYSPKQPRAVSVSELGVFDDRSPWSSTALSRDQNNVDYNDDSFHSDSAGSTISVTSSVSIPDLSHTSNHSTVENLKRPSRALSSTSRNTRGDISGVSTRISRRETVSGVISKSSRRTNSTTTQSSRDLFASPIDSSPTTSDRSSKNGKRVETKGPVQSSSSPMKSKHTRKNKLDEKVSISVQSVNTSHINSTESGF